MRRFVLLGMAVFLIGGMLLSQTVPDFSLKKTDGSVFKLSEHLDKKGGGD